jgi:hypothetical protein
MSAAWETNCPGPTNETLRLRFLVQATLVANYYFLKT